MTTSNRDKAGYALGAGGIVALIIVGLLASIAPFLIAALIVNFALPSEGYDVSGFARIAIPTFMLAASIVVEPVAQFAVSVLLNGRGYGTKWRAGVMHLVDAAVNAGLFYLAAAYIMKTDRAALATLALSLILYAVTSLIISRVEKNRVDRAAG